MGTSKKKTSKPAKTSATKSASAKPKNTKPAAKAKNTKAVATKVAPKKKPVPVSQKPQKPRPKAEKSAAPKESAAPARKIKLNDPFLKKQRERLLQLKDTLLDSMSGVARDSLRSRAEGNEASAFGMHQADAGSDAYDRDFALSLISQEQDALYEIDEALKRIESGSYGVCEMSGKAIPRARLEALPFTRYTVECQSELEKTNRFRRVRQPVTSLFGLGDDDSGDDDDDNSSDNKE